MHLANDPQPTCYPQRGAPPDGHGSLRALFASGNEVHGAGSCRQILHGFRNIEPSQADVKSLPDRVKALMPRDDERSQP